MKSLQNLAVPFSMSLVLLSACSPETINPANDAATDARIVDARVDANNVDASRVDAGVDAQVSDSSSMDSGLDSAVSDASSMDASLGDATISDASTSDAQTFDAQTFDAGTDAQVGDAQHADGGSDGGVASSSIFLLSGMIPPQSSNFSNGTVVGFNLDNAISMSGSSACVARADHIGPYGDGIDNRFGLAFGSFVGGELQRTINSGDFGLTFEFAEGPSPTVTIRMLPATFAGMLTTCSGAPCPNQQIPMGTVVVAQAPIVADPTDSSYVLIELSDFVIVAYNTPVRISGARLRGQLSANGLANAALGGWLGRADFAQVVQNAGLPSFVMDQFDSNADSEANPENAAQCLSMSVGLQINLVPARF